MHLLFLFLLHFKGQSGLITIYIPCVEIECNDGDKKRYEIGLLKEAEERPVVVNPHDGGQKH